MEYGAVALWWLTYQALLLAGLPIAGRLVPRFPDRGASLALPVALLVVTLPVFWLGHLSFGVLTLLVGVGVLAGAIALATRRGFSFDRRTYAETVVVFTVAFAFLLAIRSVDAGAVPGGGEKFLDFGLLKSLLRASYLPPADMWFAGHRIAYYYGDHLMAAILAKITGTPGRYAYNLALAGFYATEATAVYGIAGAIADERAFPRRLAGAFAVFLFGFASNLFTPARLVMSLMPHDVKVAVAHAIGKPVARVAVTPSTFSYWGASRVIPDTINEFPFFSYLNGDLHAHMVVLTMFLLVVGVCYAYYRTPAAQVWRRRALVFGVLPPVVGMIIFISTWSFPTSLGVVWLTLTFADAPPRTLLWDGAAERLSFAVDDGPSLVRRELQSAALAALAAVVVGALAVVWVAPFVLNVLLTTAADRSIAFLPTRTGLGPLLLVHGAFVLTFALYLADRWGVEGRVVPTVVAALGLVAAGWYLDLAALALVGPLLVGGWYLLRRDRAGFETVLLVGGAGLVVLVEFVYLKDHAAPQRMNTVFKTYMQVWALWAVAAGVALVAIASLWADVGPVLRSRLLGDRQPPTLSPRNRQAAGSVFAAVLVLSLSLYGGLALENQFTYGHGPTLDAMQFAHRTHPEEAAAIEWLDARPGQPHIAAAPGWKTYTWVNPASSLTGLPTVVGWAHEAIYRGYDAYARRATDVKILYTGDTVSRAAILRKYDVRYIYVGPEERKRYGAVPFGGEPGISVAYHNDVVTIYAVNQTALS